MSNKQVSRQSTGYTLFQCQSEWQLPEFQTDQCQSSLLWSTEPADTHSEQTDDSENVKSNKLTGNLSVNYKTFWCSQKHCRIGVSINWKTLYTLNHYQLVFLEKTQYILLPKRSNPKYKNL